MPAPSESKMHAIQETRDRAPKTLIVTVQPQLRSNAEQESSIQELERLARTLGLDVVGVESQKRTNASPSTYVGPGRLKEIARMTGGSGHIPTHGQQEEEDDDVYLNDIEPIDVDLVLVNDTLSPRLHRTLEHALGREVLDRTGLILEIFEKRARTREAKIEIEIARLNYELPRLRDSRLMRGREGGGGGRGEQGNTVIALCKGRIRARIAQLESELEQVRAATVARKRQRHGIFQVALVGYTNAGKSSLMRGLSGSEVLVEDKLFATLGTTARQLEPPTSPPVVLSDTVGFIQELPHELVASFRSTLDEAADADLVLLVLDASDPSWRDHLEVTRETLASIDVDERRIRIVFNKCDQLEERARLSLRALWPGSLQTSAHDRSELERLRDEITATRDRGLCREHLLLPFVRGELRAELFAHANVLEEEHCEWGTRFTLRASHGNLDRWFNMLAEDLVFDEDFVSELDDGAPSTERILEFAWRRGLELVTEQEEPTLLEDGSWRLLATDIAGASWLLQVPGDATAIERNRRASRAHALIAASDRITIGLPEWKLNSPWLVAARAPRAPQLELTPGELPPASFIRSLGAFLARLQQIEAQVVLESDLPVMTLDEIRAHRLDAIAKTSGVLRPTPAQKQRWYDWLESEDNWPEHTVLVHGSLTPAHLYGEHELELVDGFGDVGWRDPGEDLAMLSRHLEPATFDAVVNAFHMAGGKLWQGFDQHIEALASFAPVETALLALEREQEDGYERARKMLEALTA